MAGYRFILRQDQCEFIIAAMDYIEARADERISNTTCAPFDCFACRRAKERAIEIRNVIAGNIA